MILSVKEWLWGNVMAPGELMHDVIRGGAKRRGLTPSILHEQPIK